MAVGFGYIKDDKPTQVDWGQITKDANASLKSIEKDRQGRRDKIDENQREFTKMLAERPTGGDVVYQKWMGKYSAMTSAAMLENLNKLKRGDIGEQEFNTFRATVASGVEGMIATGKGYIAGFDKAAELQLGNGSALTKWQNTQSQFLFDLENVEPYIDPITGETSYFLLKEDGEKEVVNVSQGLRRVVATAEAFDTEGIIDKILEAPINEFENNLGGKEKGQFLTREIVDGVEKIIVNSDYIRTSARSAVQQGSHVFDILNLDKTGYEIMALPTEYYALNTQEERDAKLEDLHKNVKNLYVDKNDRPLESEAQRKEAEDYIVEQVKDGAQIGIKETPDLEPETSNELRLAMKALKDVGYQPSVEIARASLKKAGFSEEEVNSFTGEMIKDDKDDKKNTTKLINSLAAKEYETWFPDWLNVSPPDAKDKFEIQDINRLFRKTPFDVRKGSGGVIQIFYEDSKVPFYDFGQKSVRVFKENMSPADEQATLKGFKDKLDGQFSNNELIQLMLQVDKSIYTDIVEKLRQAKAANSAGSSTEESLDYSDL